MKCVAELGNKYENGLTTTNLYIFTFVWCGSLLNLWVYWYSRGQERNPKFALSACRKGEQESPQTAICKNCSQRNDL